MQKNPTLKRMRNQKMKIRTNNSNENLYCIYCKEPIQIGEKYIIIEESYRGEIIFKTYHLEHVPDEEDDDIYISGE